MSIIPTPPDVFGGDDENTLNQGDKAATGDAGQATRPFEEAP